MKEFPTLLQTFEYAHNGGPVDGALVIRDCDNKAAADVLNQMKERLGRKTYNFPRGVELCVVKKQLDSWLLADANAINIVSGSRRMGNSRHRTVARINETIEEITHPKDRLQRILSDVKLIYTSAVLGEIAAAIDLRELEDRIPSFMSFKESVLKIYR
jgi:hypothetical protein